MRTRWLLMSLALCAVLVLVLMLFGQQAHRRSLVLPQSIVLADGRRIDGILMRLAESTYLVQTGSESIIVQGGEIRSVGGVDVEGAGLPAVDRVPRRQETFEDLSMDGTIELHSTQYYRNEGTKILETITWGLASHELWQLETYRVLDEFGNDLAIAIEDRDAEGGKRLRIRLPRPILPGETLRLTTIYRREAGVRRDGDHWVYRNVGDYPDNRLVTRSVRLPEGAEIVRVDPEPLHRIESEGRPLVIWRRHFARSETLPWEIRYKL